MQPLIHTMEARFHAAANSSALRQLHASQDWNALLEYALLLAELEAGQRSQIKWLVSEIASTGGIQQWHLDAARELLD